MERLKLLFLSLFTLTNAQDPEGFNGIPGCRTTRLDMVFAMDGSNSVGRQFPIQKEWVKNFTTNFDISQQTTRVAIVQYSTAPETQFRFADAENVGMLHGLIDEMSLLKGNTRTGDALSLIGDEIFSEARSDAAKVLILLSDGESQDDVTSSAKNLAEQGVITFTVGIGKSDKSRTQELTKIANGEADQVFKAQDFKSISGIQKSLADKVCTFLVPDCPSLVVDAVFLMDGSTTIGKKNFELAKGFMKKVVSVS